MSLAGAAPPRLELAEPVIQRLFEPRTLARLAPTPLLHPVERTVQVMLDGQFAVAASALTLISKQNSLLCSGVSG